MKHLSITIVNKKDRLSDLSSAVYYKDGYPCGDSLILYDSFRACLGSFIHNLQDIKDSVFFIEDIDNLREGEYSDISFLQNLDITVDIHYKDVIKTLGMWERSFDCVCVLARALVQGYNHPKLYSLDYINWNQLYYTIDIDDADIVFIKTASKIETITKPTNKSVKEYLSSIGFGNMKLIVTLDAEKSTQYTDTYRHLAWYTKNKVYGTQDVYASDYYSCLSLLHSIKNTQIIILTPR